MKGSPPLCPHWTCRQRRGGPAAAWRRAPGAGSGSSLPLVMPIRAHLEGLGRQRLSPAGLWLPPASLLAKPCDRHGTSRNNDLPFNGRASLLPLTRPPTFRPGPTRRPARKWRAMRKEKSKVGAVRLPRTGTRAQGPADRQGVGDGSPRSEQWVWTGTGNSCLGAAPCSAPSAVRNGIVWCTGWCGGHLQ